MRLLHYHVSEAESELAFLHKLNSLYGGQRCRPGKALIREHGVRSTLYIGGKDRSKGTESLDRQTWTIRSLRALSPYVTYIHHERI